MNLEFSSSASYAAQIVSSGKWDALNERMQALPSGSDNEWRVKLIGALFSQTSSEYRRLTSAYENRDQGDYPLIAWRARNLLEICIWSRYCERGRQEARRLYEEAGRDTRDLYEKLLAFGRAGHFTGHTPSDWSKPFDNALKELYERAEAEGIHSLDEKHMHVRDAASECGIAEKFGLINKMLSKFAHPTALRMMAHSDQEHENLQTTYFFQWGCLFFAGVYHSLEGQLRT